MRNDTNHDIYALYDYDLNYHDAHNGDYEYEESYHFSSTSGEFNLHLKIVSGVDIFLLLVGTFLNLWFLAAISRSRDLRSLVRNKIICSVFVLHLVDSAVVIPASCFISIRYLNEKNVSCTFASAIWIIKFIQDSIVNWQIVILIVVFISQIVDFNPTTKLTPRAVRIGTWALLIIPWVVSIVVISACTSVIYGCFYVPPEITKVLTILNTAVPLILSVLLAIVAAVLRYRRFNHGHNGSMNTVLLCPGPKIDSSLAYIAAVIVSIACDILLFVAMVDHRVLSHFGAKTSIRILTAIYILNDIRVVVMVFPWLLLPDIREQIKTWKPWKRPIPNADMTVAYTA